MRTHILGASLLLLALALGAASPAGAVNVPGDYPTIQAALDAGATQILVADGTYPETLSVTHSVELLPQPPLPWDQPMPFPKVDGMTITLNSSADSVYVRGFHFTGPVLQHNGIHAYTTTLEGCWLDGGFSAQDNSGLGIHLNVRNCLVQGNLYAYVYYPHLENNVVVGGGITAWANGGGWVTGNLVIGPAAMGIYLPSVDEASLVRGNTIRHVQDGIVATAGIVDSNLVEDCTGTAYKDYGLGFFSCGPRFTNNVARRCGGDAFNCSRPCGCGRIEGNTVDSTGLSGIHVANYSPRIRDNRISHTTGHGIWVEGYGVVTLNRVLSSGADGIRTVDSPVDSNVVGRCAGTGIAAQHARHNTCYLNGGAGLELTGTAADSITHDIAYGNGGPGLRWSGTGTPFVGCNDWFLNSGGATSGIAMGPTDLGVDPLFCNVPLDDVTLSAISPLVSAPGCGQIGALGVGCTNPVTGVSGEAAPAQIGLAVRPLPARGAMLFSWTPEREGGWLQVYDVSGALRWSRAIEAGSRSVVWDGADASGTPLAPGTYFARRTAGGKTDVARVVILR